MLTNCRSDYLLKSQERVLLKLVHVSSMAWLLLMGAVNLLCYMTGIISYEAKQSPIGETLNILFLICMTIFAGVAVLGRFSSHYGRRNFVGCP